MLAPLLILWVGFCGSSHALAWSYFMLVCFLVVSFAPLSLPGLPKKIRCTASKCKNAAFSLKQQSRKERKIKHKTMKQRVLTDRFSLSLTLQFAFQAQQLEFQLSTRFFLQGLVGMDKRLISARSSVKY